MYAVDYGGTNIVSLLLHKGRADVAARDDDGRTALMYAVDYGGTNIVSLLLHKGRADGAARGANGWTALMYAVDYGRTNIVSWLLYKGGADITDTDNDGETVWTSFKGHCEFHPGTPQQTADFYSVLRCFGSPAPTPDAFIASIQERGRTFSPAHRDLLVQTEHAHAHPLLLRYRAHRLDLLSWSAPASDCTCILIPDLQNIVLEYLLSDALVRYLSEEELLSEAVIAEAQAAEEWGRENGMRMVRQRRE
jgi:hypothetical protein